MASRKGRRAAVCSATDTSARSSANGSLVELRLRNAGISGHGVEDENAEDDDDRDRADGGGGEGEVEGDGKADGG